MNSCKCKAAARVAAAVKSLVSRTLRRCKSGGGGSGAAPPVAPGCFSVYVGSERARFVVPVERANHPLFRRLLDDAEGEHGYAAQGPLALPGCNVSAFLDVLWQMEELQDDGGGDIIHTAVVSSPVCGLWRGGGGSPAAGYRMLRPLTTRSAALRWLL